MKEKKTLFEKIYWTCGVVNLTLFVTGLFFAVEEFNSVIVCILTAPFMFQVILTFLELIIVEVILNTIWGLDIDLFPSLDEKKKLKK